MKIVVRGYLTKNRALEKAAVRIVEKHAEKMLGRSIKKIDRIILTFALRNPRKWIWGHHWIVQGSTIEIYIPHIYRKYRVNTKWLIFHELGHARQRLEKRLNKSLIRVKYKSTKRARARIYPWSDAQDEFIGGTPWEKEVNNLIPRSVKSKLVGL